MSYWHLNAPDFGVGLPGAEGFESSPVIGPEVDTSRSTLLLFLNHLSGDRKHIRTVEEVMAKLANKAYSVGSQLCAQHNGLPFL